LCKHFCAGLIVLNKELKQFLRELKDAINESLGDSSSFASVLSRMEDAGYDVSLVLEAIIEVSRKTESATELGEGELQTPPPGNRLKFTALDRKFLQSIRIADDEG